eukprot:CAMPEP_0179458452 /NCGR_PEP_ID=MMETSP0799-20121207/42001_1 /TAXON_ID=46947 /ORGANISM="Geminigera cryophila, Strain CCMP2564" /LENGTH=35 /DNA_ID= /DNA_START= /DNA_END= /DNA_ORIENTATION=
MAVAVAGQGARAEQGATTPKTAPALAAPSETAPAA